LGKKSSCAADQKRKNRVANTIVKKKFNFFLIDIYKKVYLEEIPESGNFARFPTNAGEKFDVKMRVESRRKSTKTQE